MKIKLLFFLALYLSFSLHSIQNNEELTFDVTYGIVSAAEAKLTAEYIMHTDEVHTDPIPAIKATSIARTYSFFDIFFKVRDKITSISERDTGFALLYSKKLREGSYKQNRMHIYDRKNKNCYYQKWKYSTKEFREYNVAITDSTYDFLGAFYWIRKQELAVGDSLFIHMSGDGKSFLGKILVHKAQTLNTIFGKKRCLKIEPRLASEAIFKNTGRIFIWLTDDEYKIPVKMKSEVKYGSFIATLKKAKNVDLEIKK